MSLTIELTEDQFYKQYRPIPNPRDGSDFWDLQLDKHAWAQNANGDAHLWTCVDGTGGDTLVLSGWHRVNRFAFMVTEVPWGRGDDIVVFIDHSDHDSEEG